MIRRTCRAFRLWFRLWLCVAHVDSELSSLRSIRSIFMLVPRAVPRAPCSCTPSLQPRNADTSRIAKIHLWVNALSASRCLTTPNGPTPGRSTAPRSDRIVSPSIRPIVPIHIHSARVWQAQEWQGLFLCLRRCQVQGHAQRQYKSQPRRRCQQRSKQTPIDLASFWCSASSCQACQP